MASKMRYNDVRGSKRAGAIAKITNHASEGRRHKMRFCCFMHHEHRRIVQGSNVNLGGASIPDLWMTRPRGSFGARYQNALPRRKLTREDTYPKVCKICCEAGNWFDGMDGKTVLQYS